MSYQSSTKQLVLNPNDWDTSAIKYMKPYVTKSGSKSISIISKQSNRSLTISTPWMMTWGCNDFTDANGDSDGKFNLSLNFPNDDERTSETEMFLQKLKDFENQILDDAVKMSEVWWGESMSREICKHTFFPVLKYSKNKEPPHKIDYSKPPSFRAKVPNYDGVWKVEIYNTKGEIIFPNGNTDETPNTIITKLSSVACVLQSTGIWIGGKGWGVTWKLIQCAIKPKEIVSITGRCLLNLPPQVEPNTHNTIETSKTPEAENIVSPVIVSSLKSTSLPQVSNSSRTDSTNAEDTDDETDSQSLNLPTIITEKTQEETNTVHTEESIPLPPVVELSAPVPVRKVIKKTPNPDMGGIESTAVNTTNELIKKKVVKKATTTNT